MQLEINLSTVSLDYQQTGKSYSAHLDRSSHSLAVSLLNWMDSA